MESTRGGRPGSRTGTLIAISLILVLVAATLVATFTVMQFPDHVTEEADDINSLYGITLALATFVFLAVEALIIWVCFRFRRRSNTDPAQVHGSNRLEFGWTAIPVMIIVVLFVLSAPLAIDLRDSEADAADLTVNVTGRQWFWEYEYPEEGITVQEIPDYENPEDPPALVVPVDSLVVLNVTSGDVVHSFYVPDFLYKIQAIPGQVNEMHFTPEEIGTYTGQCAQFCGLNHAQMLLKVEVVSQEDYDAWVEEQQAAQEETPTPTPDGTPEPTAEPGDDDGGGATTLEITATDNQFSTDELTALAGEISIELINEGSALHNFSIPDEDVEGELIGGGETTTVTFELAEPGEYEYQCDVHPTEMQGTLIVE